MDTPNQCSPWRSLLIGSSLSLLIGLTAHAQLEVTYPLNRMVIQRNNSNQATVQIAGSYAQPLDVVEARLVARAIGQGTSTPWATLQASPLNGQFNGTLTATGGWYRIDVRGVRSGLVVATDSVSRFGIGEVFAIIGHSNAQGSSCIIGGVDQCPTRPGATDDRVNVVGVVTGTPGFYQYEQTASTAYLPGLDFSQLTTFSGMSPFAKVAWLWGRMGDVLVQRINVPVLMYNAGFGGSNMEYNYKAAHNIPFSHGFINYSIRMPYVNIRNIMNLYVPSTGIRAMLVHHGENDRGNTTDQIKTHYYGVIDKAKTDFNKPDLAWIIATTSYVYGQFANVRAAQFDVSHNAAYQTYPGPDLDVITSTAERPDGVHYSPLGQYNTGTLWANGITDAYLQAITPYMAELQPLASIACATGNQLTMTQPASFSYSWNTGSTARSLTVGAGTYQARLLASEGKEYFPPAITVPASVRPSTPTLTTSDGSLNICLSNGLTLTSSNTTDQHQWSTGATTPAITVTTPGTYTVLAKNAVYGCLSGVVSKTISLADADLSLSMCVSRRTPAVGDTVTINLRLKNESLCEARNVTIQNRLPPNLSFDSSPDGLTLSGDIVSGTVVAIAPGGTVTGRYVARLNASAVYQNAAQITAATNPDPDSQPDSGTGDGQDDTALVDLRTEPAGASYVSPNPNQTPLPPVADNQPAPDGEKADLSLSMASDRRVLRAGDVVTITMRVSNRGALTATNVRVQNQLPTGLQFLASPDGVTAAGSLVSGTISVLTPGQMGSLSFTATAQASGSGQVIDTAQITLADQLDPDSTAGNGFSKGEDDDAQIELRILTP